MNPPVRCHGLTKAYGFRTVLTGVDLTVASGEVVALFGANGAGKSTLLRVIAGLAGRFGGRLELFGQPITAVTPDVRRRLGFLGHQSYCYEVLSGLENLMFYASLYDLPQPRELALHWLDRVGLTLFAHEPMTTYSRGMQQRLALARCLLPEPDVLLLDEPATGLDLVGADILEQVVLEAKQRGATVLLVTHEVRSALAMSDRVILLAGGQVAATALTAGLDPNDWAAICRDAIGNGRVV